MNNPTRLHDVLTRHDANPTTVLAQLHTKRVARRRRHYALTGVLSALAVAGIGTTVVMNNSDHSNQPHGATAAAPTTVNPSAAGLPDTATAAQACVELPETFDRALQEGASIITAHSARTGKTDNDGYDFQQMKLTDVQTLAGPKINDGATAWTLVPTQPETPSPGVIEIGPDGPLWDPAARWSASTSPRPRR